MAWVTGGSLMPKFTFFPLRFGLRFKLLLLSCFLFSIPLLGYQYVWEMEKYLRIGQEKTLMGTVRAVATALHERPKLFDEQASFLPNVKVGRDLYAYPIVEPIQLDGHLSDWKNRAQAIQYDESYLIEGQNNYHNNTLSFKHRVGKYNNYLYAFFAVTDESIVYRAKNSLQVDNNDLLQIAFTTPTGDFRRYLISTYNEGWLTPYELDINDQNNNIAKQPEKRIQGMWRETNIGYNIELRIPLELLGSQLSFAITDYDENRLEPITMGTAQFKQANQLGTVLVPSPEIEKIVKGLGHSESRIWVVDQHGRVLAKSGDLNGSDGVWSNIAKQVPKSSWYQPIQEKLTWLYNQVLTSPPDNFIDNFYQEGQLQGQHLTKALSGKSAATWRLTTDNKAVILSAAYPIYSGGKVQGAVVAEETTNGIRTLRNQALQGWFNVILAVMGLGTLALFIFASRVSSRIRSLNLQTEQAIDDQGRIVNAIAHTNISDEVGDLQRSFAHMVQRLGQYTSYLQGMSARLSHELRTPVAVVKSSLESLVMDLPESENNVYMHRAQEGVNRLSSILRLMSEATRLEQSLENTELISYNLQQVVQGCVQGYQLIQPNQPFNLHINDKETGYKVHGNPELFAQLLDKLLANAVEFTANNATVHITLTEETVNQTIQHVLQQKKCAVLTIENIGQSLPDEMQERLFDSMVSVRSQTNINITNQKNSELINQKATQQTSAQQTTVQNEQPHLGLGLYIARLIAELHQGSISINNNESQDGVVARVLIPLS